MRAVARGLFLNTLPLCPEQCGGVGVDLSTLDPARLHHRARHGCDAPIPSDERVWYAIRCPRCDGAAASGAHCDVCSDDGYPGFKKMRRCPASHCSPDIGDAMKAMSWVVDGILPDDGGLGDQSISFVDFRTLFDAEKNETLAEQRKEG